MDGSGELTAQVAASLQGGPYAPASLEKLSGGTANFVYRVLLSKALEDGTKTVVVKHTEGFVALNPTFKLPENRCVRPKLHLGRLRPFFQYSLIVISRNSSRASFLPWAVSLPPPAIQSRFRRLSYSTSPQTPIPKYKVTCPRLQPLKPTF
jgi:hypothetical protein